MLGDKEFAKLHFHCVNTHEKHYADDCRRAECRPKQIHFVAGEADCHRCDVKHVSYAESEHAEIHHGIAIFLQRLQILRFGIII